jgi:hypothetical protein
VDTITPYERYLKNISYLFGQFDNEQRKEKVVKGMIENIRNGYSVGPNYLNSFSGCPKKKERSCKLSLFPDHSRLENLL